VIPDMIDPRQFGGIVETPDAYIKVRLKVGLNGPPAQQVEEVTRFRKGDWSTPAANHVSHTRAGAVFRGFARFPGIQVEETTEGYRVTFIDFRFYNERAGSGFGGEVLLDRKLRPMAESLSFRQKAP
jgi:hypothetical protein